MDTIKSSADISELFARGRRFNTPFITLIVLPSRHGQSFEESGRVAFIAGKKQGNAVWRNAAKRRMREICRSVGGPWKGIDVVFLAKGSILSASYEEVKAAVERVLRREDWISTSSVGV